MVVNEELLVAPQQNGAEVMDLWSMGMIISAAGIVIVLVIAITAVLFKRRQSKATKIDGTLGTDV